MLFYVRQKHQDLLTQLAVSIQGYLAIDLIRKNNIELIKGVDRATTTTISALRTAVIVAQALANQKLVLDQITALNTTTSNLIESTSKLLATQSVAINEQAASSTIGIDKLEAAFTNIYQTMDAIDDVQGAGVDSMQTTIDTLSTEIQKSQKYLARARGTPTHAARVTLTSPKSCRFRTIRDDTGARRCPMRRVRGFYNRPPRCGSGVRRISAAYILPRDRPGRPASLSIAARSIAVSKEIRSCR